MAVPNDFPLEADATGGAVRYRMETAPLIVHCCHCRWCQRETGASFALNALIESDRVANLGVEPDIVDTPSASGRGQQIARCPHCGSPCGAITPARAGLRRSCASVRWISRPAAADIHIFTASKQPWVVIPPECARCPSTTHARRSGPRKAARARDVLRAQARGQSATR